MKKGWEMKTLGDLYDITSSKRVFESDWRKSGVPFYRAREIVKLAKQGFVDNELFISEEMYKQYSEKYGIPKEGDIMVTGVGTLGICYVVKKNDKFYFKDGNIIWLKTKNGINSRFIEYAFQSDFLRKQIDDSVGATVGTFTIIKAKNTVIPIPPLPEQQRIVSVLDEAFASIAQAKSNAERNLVNARELFESVLQEIFELSDSEWEEKKIKEIGITQTGTTPKTANKENYGDFIPFIKPADIDISGDGEIRYDNDGLSEEGLGNGRKILSGSVLMVCIGASIGKVGFVHRDVTCNQQINTLTVNSGFYPKFFYYALRTQGFYNQVIKNSAQMTLPIINKSKWENLTVHFPKSLAEQRAIVGRLEALSAETGRLEEIYQSKVESLEELKKSVLGKAFSGEL